VASTRVVIPFNKHGPIQHREGLHPVEVTRDLNIELSEVTGKLLLKRFSNF
jgi:hypothetical protein